MVRRDLMRNSPSSEDHVAVSSMDSYLDNEDEIAEIELFISILGSIGVPSRRILPPACGH